MANFYIFPELSQYNMSKSENVRGSLKDQVSSLWVPRAAIALALNFGATPRSATANLSDALRRSFQNLEVQKEKRKKRIIQIFRIIKKYLI